MCKSQERKRRSRAAEKFIIYGGAIQLAGQVRAKGEARRTRSDFMQMEKDRGISVSASAMSFDFNSYRFNLVDTPGHSDFSEDTYRTLTAVDSAIMVIDGAKGVETQKTTDDASRRENYTVHIVGQDLTVVTVIHLTPFRLLATGLLRPHGPWASPSRPFHISAGSG